MKHVFYGFAGEGRGHAGRVKALIERMPHNFHLFTWGDGLDYFRGYHNLYEVSPLSFARTGGKINRTKTALGALGYFTRLKKDVEKVSRLADRFAPSLFISDFDWVVPRVASGAPLVSIDNQHEFSRLDMRLPLPLSVVGKIMGAYAEWACPSPSLSFITSFLNAPVKKSFAHNTFVVPPLVKKEIEGAEVTCGDHVVVYYKRSVGPKILDSLNELGMRAVVFCCPEEERRFPFVYGRPHEFVDSLASCRAVFGAAGHQLMSEARYLGKPVFAVPEPNQYEQAANAHSLRWPHGVGVKLSELHAGHVRFFLEFFSPYEIERINGADVVANYLNPLLK